MKITKELINEALKCPIELDEEEFQSLQFLLSKLLLKVFEEEEGKRPFGDSGWKDCNARLIYNDDGSLSAESIFCTRLSDCPIHNKQYQDPVHPSKFLLYEGMEDGALISSLGSKDAECIDMDTRKKPPIPLNIKEDREQIDEMLSVPEIVQEMRQALVDAARSYHSKHIKRKNIICKDGYILTGDEGKDLLYLNAVKAGDKKWHICYIVEEGLTLEYKITNKNDDWRQLTTPCLTISTNEPFILEVRECIS